MYYLCNVIYYVTGYKYSKKASIYKMKEKKRIWLPQGNTKKIAALFGCTSQMVSRSTAGVVDSELAKKIRHVAMKDFDGIEITPKK